MRKPDVGIVENFLKRDGRLNRLRYFKRSMVIALAEFIILFIIMLFAADMSGKVSTFGGLVVKVLSVVGIYPFFCVAARRLHDMDKDETFAYIMSAISIVSIVQTDYTGVREPTFIENILYLVSGVLWLYIMFVPGTRGPNRYGDNPLS